MAEIFLRCHLLKWFLLYLCGFMLAACANSYQPDYGLLAGGYAEMRFNTDTYRVEYRGGLGSSISKVRSLLLYRCAEIALGTGHDSFVIVWGYEVNGTAVALITLFSNGDVAGSPEGQNAKEVRDVIREKYRLSSDEFVSKGMFLDKTDGYSYSEIGLDENTYRIGAFGDGSTVTARNTDHLLIAQSARLTSQNGADYFVILSQDSQHGRWKCGGLFFGEGCATLGGYYDRSLVIRLFKGVKPIGWATAIEAKNFQAKDSTFPEQTVTQSNQAVAETHVQAASTSVENVVRRIHCPTDGLWTGGQKKERLEIGLIYRCAEQTLREGYEYFAFEKADDRVLSWRELISGPFEVQASNGGPMFRGAYGKDNTMQGGVWAKIRLVGKDTVVDEPFAFHARTVLKFLAPVLQAMSEDTVVH